MSRVLHLPSVFAETVRDAAALAFPEECCGLIVGIDVEDGWRATMLQETANLAEEPTRRFLIDPRAQFDLMKRLRETDRRIIGCFHSHPGGRPEPSAADRAEAYEDSFVYLIAGGSAGGGFALKAWWFTEADGFAEVAIVAGTGAPPIAELDPRD